MKSEQIDVVIVGGGPAGLSAALELKKRNVGKVVVLDRESKAGGIPRFCHHTGFGVRDLHRVYSGPQYAKQYVQQALDAGVEIRTLTTVTGLGDSNRLTYTTPQGLGKIEAQAILLATGCRERSRGALLTPGRRTQGIFTTGSLQRFVDEPQLPIGKKAIIVGAELVSLSALMTLMNVTVEVPLMITPLPKHQIYFPFVAMKWLTIDMLRKTTIQTSTQVYRILGNKRVEAVELINLDTGNVTTVDCDTVVYTGNWLPDNEVARNGELIIDSGTLGPQVDGSFQTSRTGVFVAGNLMRGAETAGVCALEGRHAAQSIHDFMQSKDWPTSNIPIHIEQPLAWIFPNCLTKLNTSFTNKVLTFQVLEICHNASVHVSQGKEILYTKQFRCLPPKRSIKIDCHWLNKVNPDGESLKMSIIHKLI
jgi:thioredoxin reductase